MAAGFSYMLLNTVWPAGSVSVMEQDLGFSQLLNKNWGVRGSVEQEGSVEEEVLVAVQEADNAGTVVCRGPHHLHSVCPLKVGLHHFIVFPITQGQRFQVGAAQPVKYSYWNKQ